MNINITGKNMDLTDAIHDFTVKKFEKLTDHYRNITSANIVFDIEKINQVAEATIHIPNHQIHAKAESDDLYHAIEMLIEKLNKQVIKFKEKDQAK